MAKSLLLVLCLSLVMALGWGHSTPSTGATEPPDVRTVAPTEDETLQNEADNQENVLSQVGCESHVHSSCPGDVTSLEMVLSEVFRGSGLSPLPKGRAFVFHLSELFSEVKGHEFHFQRVFQGYRTSRKEERHHTTP